MAMTPQKQLDAFTAACKKVNWMFNKKTSSMKDIVTECEKQIKGGATKAFDRQAEVKKLQDAYPKNEKKFMKYSNALGALFACWGTDKDYTLPTGKTTGKAADLVKKHKATLERIGGFACSDAKNFPKVIAKGKEKEVLDQYKNLDQKLKAKEAQANSVAGGKTSFRQGVLKNVHDLVMEATSACCTTFACTAAHVLTEGKRQQGPRVEIVALKQTHCYVIVGREGEPGDEDNLNNYDTWGNGCMVVDCWLGSLRHPSIFNKWSDFPQWAREKGKLEQYYDSLSEDPEEVGRVVDMSKFAHLK